MYIWDVEMNVYFIPYLSHVWGNNDNDYFSQTKGSQVVNKYCDKLRNVMVCTKNIARLYYTGYDCSLHQFSY